MLGWFKRFFRWVTTRNTRVISCIVIGLDGAGKSSLLASLSGDLPGQTTATVGFSSEVIQRGKYQIKLFDLGGGAMFRNIWERYYAEVYGAIFVLDASDHQKIDIAREVFSTAFQSPSLCNKPILICANKQDLVGALKVADVTTQMQVDQLAQYPLSVISTNAFQRPLDPNLANGISWLVSQIDMAYTNLEHRIQKDVEEQRGIERRDKEERLKRVSELHDEMEHEESEQKAKRKQDAQRRRADVLKERERASSDLTPPPLVPIYEIECNNTIDDTLNSHQRSPATLTRIPSLGHLALNTPAFTSSSPSASVAVSHKPLSASSRTHSLSSATELTGSGKSNSSDHAAFGKPAQQIIFNNQTGQYEKLTKPTVTNKNVKTEHTPPILSLPDELPLAKLVRNSRRRSDKHEEIEEIEKSEKSNDEMDDGMTRNLSDFPEPLELREVSQRQFLLSTDWPVRKEVLPSIQSSLNSVSSSSSFLLAPLRSDLSSSTALLPSLRPSSPSMLSPPLTWEKMDTIEEDSTPNHDMEL